MPGGIEKITKTPDFFFLHFSYFFRTLVSGGDSGCILGCILWLGGALYSVGSAGNRNPRVLEPPADLLPWEHNTQRHPTKEVLRAGLSQDCALSVTDPSQKAISEPCQTGPGPNFCNDPWTDTSVDQKFQGDLGAIGPYEFRGNPCHHIRNR